jgi:hypothetical protein
MIDPWFRFLKRQPAGGNRPEDVGTGATAAVSVWISVKKGAAQRFSKLFFFVLG